MSTEDDETTPGAGEEVGSLGEEAMRLLGTLSGWVGQHGSSLHDGAEEVFRHGVDAVQDVAHGMDEHLATGAAECTWCPVCRAVHAVRELTPEVRTHLTSAASSLVKAAAALLATPVDPQARASGHDTSSSRSSGPRTSDRVQHIDLDDDPDPDAST